MERAGGPVWNPWRPPVQSTRRELIINVYLPVCRTSTGIVALGHKNRRRWEIEDCRLFVDRRAGCGSGFHPRRWRGSQLAIADFRGEADEFPLSSFEFPISIFEFRFSDFGLLVFDFAQGAHSEPHLRRGREGHRQEDFVPAQLVQSRA